MRLPYVDENPQLENPDDQAVVDRVKQRRGGKLIELDRALLHAPPVADGWNAFLGAIRTKTTLAVSIRELAISRVAVLNKAWYEWEAHYPILESAKVLSADAVSFLKLHPLEQKTEVEEFLQKHDGLEKLFDAKHRSVLQYTDAMTLGIVVPEGKFNDLKSHFSEREVIEITATVAAYNTVSRFLVALDVGEMSERYGVSMK